MAGSPVGRPGARKKEPIDNGEKTTPPLHFRRPAGRWQVQSGRNARPETGAVWLRIDTIEQGRRDLCGATVQGEAYRLAYPDPAVTLKLAHVSLSTVSYRYGGSGFCRGLHHTSPGQTGRGGNIPSSVGMMPDPGPSPWSRPWWRLPCLSSASEASTGYGRPWPEWTATTASARNWSA